MYIFADNQMNCVSMFFTFPTRHAFTEYLFVRLCRCRIS